MRNTKTNAENITKLEMVVERGGRLRRNTILCVGKQRHVCLLGEAPPQGPAIASKKESKNESSINDKQGIQHNG